MCNRILAVIVAICLTHETIAQQSIGFATAANGALQPDSKPGQPYALPLALHFPATLAGQTVAIYDAAALNVLTLNNIKFGAGLSIGEDKIYTITIQADGNILEVPAAPAMNQNSFKVKIGNNFYGPFTLAAGPQIPVADKRVTPGTGPAVAPSSYSPNYLFDDAFTIYTQLATNPPIDPKTLINILNFYHVTADNYRNNPFLVDMLGPIYAAGIEAVEELTQAGTGGAIGGADVTKLADGLAQFLVERFKEELSEAFFNKLKKDLESTQFADLRILFPNTFNKLETIGDQIYQYTIFIKALRQAFITDLTNGYTNLNTLLQQQKYRQYFTQNHPEIGSVLYTALYYINGLKAQKHPGDILDQFTGVLNAGQPNLYFGVCPSGNCSTQQTILQSNLTAGVKTLQLLSWALRSRSAKTYWVPADSVAQLFASADLKGLKIFLGLLWQELHQPTIQKPYTQISFAYDNAGAVTPMTLIELLNQAAPHVDDLNVYKNFITDLINKATAVDQSLTDFKAKKSTERDYNDYYQVYSSATSLLQQISGFVDLPHLGLTDQYRQDFKQTAGRIASLAQSAGELYIDINSGNYSSAVQSVIGVLDTAFSGDGDASANYSKIRGSLLKYGSFIAAVAEAKTSADVKNAIESIALPAGSFSIKQHSAHTITLNGFVGYGFDLGHYFSSGIYAPVGLAFSWGLGTKKRGGALWVFASALDVGAIVSYRVKDDTTSQLKQNVRLESILSPSLQLMYEFPGVPITLCAGLRLTPKLFYSSDESFQVVKPRVALNLSILVDIPIITISNKIN